MSSFPFRSHRKNSIKPQADEVFLLAFEFSMKSGSEKLLIGFLFAVRIACFAFCLELAFEWICFWMHFFWGERKGGTSRQKSLQRIYCSPFTNNSRVGASHGAMKFLARAGPRIFFSPSPLHVGCGRFKIFSKERKRATRTR